MEEDLGLSPGGNQFQTALSLLFVTYVLSEVPSNLVLKKFTPSRWIAFITTVSVAPQHFRDKISQPSSKPN